MLHMWLCVYNITYIILCYIISYFMCIISIYIYIHISDITYIYIYIYIRYYIYIYIYTYYVPKPVARESGADGKDSLSSNSQGAHALRRVRLVTCKAVLHSVAPATIAIPTCRPIRPTKSSKSTAACPSSNATTRKMFL